MGKLEAPSRKLLRSRNPAMRLIERFCAASNLCSRGKLPACQVILVHIYDRKPLRLLCWAANL
jgi:hypothetical protein